MVIAKKYVLAKHFEGEPKRSDLTLVEEELPPVKNGEILIHAEYLSVDPYMRAYSAKCELGTTMIGSQVAKIVESKHPDYSVGKYIVGYYGWRSHSIVNPDSVPIGLLNTKGYLLSDFGGLSPSLALGMLGMPGNTAYFGLLEICKPKAGETLVVSSAAGAVGSHVGQLGKILGLNVIGITGSDAKCKWLKDDLGFDHVINYKTQDVMVALAEAAPNGVDCYFDNVGGDIATIVLSKMNLYGRIALCGCISTYNADPKKLPKTSVIQPYMLWSQLRMEGFIVSRWNDRWNEGIQKNLSWIHEGKLKHRETITNGFENMFNAFIGVLRGENVGKAIVKV